MKVDRAKEDRSIITLSSEFYHVKVRSGIDWGIYAAMKWNEDDNMLHFIDHTPPDRPEQTSQQDKIISVLSPLFTDQQRFIYTHLTKAYMSKAGVARSTATLHIKKAVEMNFLSKEGDFYFLADNWEIE